VSDRAGVFNLVAGHPGIRDIIHLAAQAGVRHSLTDPFSYIDANIMGSLIMLEAARRCSDFRALVYASSSSVSGANTKQPFSTADRVDQPVSLYGATKRSCELIAESYARLYGLPVTGLRFFTVYGPWGRPDMAAYLFTSAILTDQPIRVFNESRMARDSTYVDDIVTGVVAAVDRPGRAGEHRIYNLGNHRPERLLDFVATLERILGRTAERQLLPMQAGDVEASFADIDTARRDLGFEPKVTIETGLERFVEWYKEYHGLS
jgi:UDP-glucuronate 4-epimerase